MPLLCADVDYILLSCLFDWSYYSSYAMTMLLPVVVTLIFAFRHYFLNLGFDKCVCGVLVFVVIVYNGLVTKIFQVIFFLLLSGVACPLSLAKQSQKS